MPMNSNEVMESSTLVALTGLNVVIEDESDYVFVAEGDLNVDEWNDDDESSYDHCDLSTTLSCATSVATNITLRDLNLIEEEEDSNSIVAMDIFDSIDGRDDDDAVVAADDDAPDDDDADDDDDDGEDGSLSKRRNDHRDVLGVTKVFPFVMANPKNGRRLSNKKLRKKLKMMKKAAAAKAAFEVAMANQKALSTSLIHSSSMNLTAAAEEEAPSSNPKRTTSSSSSSRFKSTSTSSSSSSSSSSPKRKSTRSNSIAVACAQESLAAYREEIEAGKLQKKAARFAAIV